MPALSFGLNAKGKASAGKPSVAATKKLAFGGGDSDDEAPAKQDNTQEISTFDEDSVAKPVDSNKSSTASASKNTKAPTRPPRPNAASSSFAPSLAASLVQKKHNDEATALDASVYDYDAHYDAIHAKDAARKAAERTDAASGKAKYMENLLAAAETRKRDQLRARDKLLQREREAEGDEFADKEKFVTEAYKAQQEEARKIEAEEKQKEEEEERMKRKQGMAGFFRNVMDQQEKDHQEAVQAAADAAASGTTTALDEEHDSDEKTDIQRARELNQKGANILINDEGEIADKRQLLTAGLNVSTKAHNNAQLSSSSRSSQQQQRPAAHMNMDAKQAMRERQSRMMEAQLEQATKRAAEEEAEEIQRREQAAKSSKTAGDISDAKARYLARKAAAAAEKK